jgi:hypothetical protein
LEISHFFYFLETCGKLIVTVKTFLLQSWVTVNISRNIAHKLWNLTPLSFVGLYATLDWMPLIEHKNLQGFEKDILRKSFLDSVTRLGEFLPIGCEFTYGRF